MDADLFAVAARVLRVPPAEITIESSPETVPGWDSLRHMRLILSVEEAFNVEFTEEEIGSIVDIRSLEQVVARYRS